MSTWRRSPKNKTSLKQKLLSTREFNFTNRFLWKLPMISAKYNLVSPNASPLKVRTEKHRIKRLLTVSVEKEMEQTIETESTVGMFVGIDNELLVKGTTKTFNQQYFRKTYLPKNLQPKNKGIRVKRLSQADEYSIGGWEDEYL